MLKVANSVISASRITGVLPVVNGGTGVTTSTGTGSTVLSAAPTLSGNVTLSTGNLVVADTKGIDFSATSSGSGTMTSELLADYEEGTWTAVLSDGTNNATMVANTQSYTKIGRSVTVSGYMQTSSLGSVSGNLRITGLPYATAFHGSGAVGLGLNLNLVAGQVVSMFVDPGVSYIVPTLWDAATGTTTMQASEWSSDGFIAFTFTYVTT